MKNKKETLVINDFSDSFIYQNNSTVTFINELQIGKTKIPVRTEIDFNNVDESQYEKYFN